MSVFFSELPLVEFRVKFRNPKKNIIRNAPRFSGTAFETRPKNMQKHGKMDCSRLVGLDEA